MTKQNNRAAHGGGVDTYWAVYLNKGLSKEPFLGLESTFLPQQGRFPIVLFLAPKVKAYPCPDGRVYMAKPAGKGGHDTMGYTPKEISEHTEHLKAIGVTAFSTFKKRHWPEAFTDHIYNILTELEGCDKPLADHISAAVRIVLAGINPDNEDRGFNGVAVRVLDAFTARHSSNRSLVKEHLESAAKEMLSLMFELGAAEQRRNPSQISVPGPVEPDEDEDEDELLGTLQ